MTVHRSSAPGLQYPPVHLQKALPSLPSRDFDFYHTQVVGTASRFQPSRNGRFKRSVTAPQLPTLTKSTAIRRNYDYTPVRSLTITKVPAHRVSLLRSYSRSQTRSISRSRTPSLDKPLPAKPIYQMNTTIMSTSSTSTTNATNSKSEPHVSSENSHTAEFSGDLETNNELPSRTILNDVADLPVLNAEGKELTFKSLYLPQKGEEQMEVRRVMVIFIRHFFCGVSQT